MSFTLSSLPEIADRHAFNCRRWEEIEQDRTLASLEQRIETDAYGRIIVIPPSGFNHSNLQGLVIEKLLLLMAGRDGRVRPECPLSTTEGVKGIDAVWISNRRVEDSLRSNLLTKAPEICVEVLSPSNTREEIENKTRLYFEAGAEEVWVCSAKGEMAFYSESGEVSTSLLCPEFSRSLEVES